MARDIEIKVLTNEQQMPLTPVERTKLAMQTMTEGRKNQARAFFKRAKKSDTKRRAEKASRKWNRR